MQFRRKITEMKIQHLNTDFYCFLSDLEKNPEAG